MAETSELDEFMTSVRIRMDLALDAAHRSGALSGDEFEVALYRAVLCIIAENDIAYSKTAQKIRNNLIHFI